MLCFDSWNFIGKIKTVLQVIEDLENKTWVELRDDNGDYYTYNLDHNDIYNLGIDPYKLRELCIEPDAEEVLGWATALYDELNDDMQIFEDEVIGYLVFE